MNEKDYHDLTTGKHGKPSKTGRTRPNTPVALRPDHGVKK